MRKVAALLTIVPVLLGAVVPAGAVSLTSRFQSTIDAILAEPYQPNYVPQGIDSAFGSAAVLNTAPAQDGTTGSIPGSSDAPAWPPIFKAVVLDSADGAPLPGQLALQPGKRPGIVVVHGFNTHGSRSIVRWAAMLAANGYNVLVADLRDVDMAYTFGHGSPDWPPTIGWKEAEHVLAMGRFLKAQPGVTSVGVLGFGLGAQSTVLALALDGAQTGESPVFATGLQWSGPADQNSQIHSTAYAKNDVCAVLDATALHYGTTPYTILTQEAAYRRQLTIRAPLLGFYSADDPIVLPFHSTMMAGYQAGRPLQRTIQLTSGDHAYFYDRWWQQRAILLYFKGMLPCTQGDPTIGTTPTVNQTEGGAPAREQLVDLGASTRALADAQAAPFVCDPRQPPPAHAAQ